MLGWRRMKIGVAQINGVVGDFPGNAKRLLAAYRECLEGGAELVVTPEMFLAGYPPRDLVFKSGFVDRCLQALDYLADEVGEVPMLVGYVDHNQSSGRGKPFRNAAALLQGGKIHGRVWKTLLPSYDVFDERRYFEPGEECRPMEWNGMRLGVTICEDIWTEDYLHRPIYHRDPLDELRDAGVDLIVNLSASPFHAGKQGEPLQLSLLHEPSLYLCLAIMKNFQRLLSISSHDDNVIVVVVLA